MLKTEKNTVRNRPHCSFRLSNNSEFSYLLSNVGTSLNSRHSDLIPSEGSGTTPKLFGPMAMLVRTLPSLGLWIFEWQMTRFGSNLLDYIDFDRWPKVFAKQGREETSKTWLNPLKVRNLNTFTL